MKIAATYENGEIFQHFGHTEQFKIYEVKNGKIVGSEVVGNDGLGHGALAGYLKSMGVEKLVCGGIGGGARQMLGGMGIEVYPGVSGNADEQVERLVSGTLDFDPETTCHHHDRQEGSCTCGRGSQ